MAKVGQSISGGEEKSNDGDYEEWPMEEKEMSVYLPCGNKSLV